MFSALDSSHASHLRASPNRVHTFSQELNGGAAVPSAVPAAVPTAAPTTRVKRKLHDMDQDCDTALLVRRSSRVRGKLEKPRAASPSPFPTAREKVQTKLLRRFPVVMIHALFAAGYCLRRDACFEPLRLANGHMLYLHRYFPHVVPCALMHSTPTRVCTECRRALLAMAGRSHHESQVNPLAVLLLRPASPNQPNSGEYQ